MSATHVKLNLPAFPGEGTLVELDGFDMTKAIRSLTLDASAGSTNSLTLKLALVGGEMEGEARLYLSAAQVGLLARFGWQPPEHATFNERGDALLVRHAPVPINEESTEERGADHG